MEKISTLKDLPNYIPEIKNICSSCGSQLKSTHGKAGTRKCRICISQRDTNVKRLHTKGLASRQIAENLNLTLQTVKTSLCRMGLRSNRYHHHIVLDEKGCVKCSKCSKVVHYLDLPLQKRKKHSYRLSYCRDCHWNQTGRNGHHGKRRRSRRAVHGL